MYNKKPFFIVFEGIEGSGKSYQSKKLYKSLKKRNLNIVFTREPGGSIGAERIRKLILEDYFHKKSKEQFNKYTDTLLYLAARNEHIQNKIKPALMKKKIIICDRFVDSTTAYQVIGKGVDRKFIENIHKKILFKTKPNLTFVLKVKLNVALNRLKKRKTKNRYDKFPQSFYNKAQKSFINIAKKNRKTHYIFDNSKDNPKLEKNILDIVLKKIKF